MKFNKLFILLLLPSFALTYIENTPQQSGKISTTQPEETGCGCSSTCECYCSVKCGPRKVDRSKGDLPFYDPVRKQCFCKKRDQILYYKNQCHIKEKGNKRLFKNSCCPQTQE